MTRKASASQAIADDELLDTVARAYDNDKTRASYLARLEALKTALGKPTLYDIVADPTETIAALTQRYPNLNTRKNVLTTLLVLFKHSERLRRELKAQHSKFLKFHDAVSGFINSNIYARNLPSPQQLAKYTPWEDIVARVKELRAGKEGDPHRTQALSIEFVLLSVLSSVPPKRSDYGSMRVYYGREPKSSTLASENYLVMRERQSYFAFHKYKTSGHSDTEPGKRVDEVLPPAVDKDVKDSLRRHPRDYLFVNRFGEPFSSNQGFSQFVIRVFKKYFDRATGVTMLRHIYITDNLSWDNMSDEQLMQVSMQMMHASAIQRKYHWNKAAICQNLRTVCDRAEH